MPYLRAEVCVRGLLWIVWSIGCVQPGSGDGDAEAEGRFDLVAAPADPTRFVVFELFTSQACLYCPKADRYLNEIARDYRDSGVPVYAVAWHTTRWDGLQGWTDLFSDERHTDRHHAYLAALEGRVYVPQMVVQGRASFNGQASAAIEDAVEHWLRQPGSHVLGLDVARPDGDAVDVTVAVDGPPAGAELQVILLEGGLVVDVTAGENAGETLEHENVARSWVTVPATAGAATLPLPPDVDHEQAWVLALLQDPASLAVLGAAQVRLSRRSSP